MQAQHAIPVKRVAIVGPDGRGMLRLRSNLIRDLIAARHSVHCLVGNLESSDRTEIERLGASVDRIAIAGDDPQLIGDRRNAKAIRAALAEWYPHVVLGYGARIMALAAMAARKLHDARSVVLVSELGSALPAGTGRPGWRWRRLLGAGFAAADVIVFHNGTDLRRMREDGLVPTGKDVQVVVGGGVDTLHFSAMPLPPFGDGLTFLAIGALSHSKGVGEFVEAARRVRATAPGARFLLVGPDGVGSHAVDRVALAASCDGVVEVLSDQSDVRPWLARAHVFVQPSHVEGLSRTLIEALAVGRPVIASNIAGCREAIDERVNGVLVQPRDPGALADAMLSMLKRPELLAAMARASRLKAERRFDVRDVNRALMGAMGLG